MGPPVNRYDVVSNPDSLNNTTGFFNPQKIGQMENTNVMSSIEYVGDSGIYGNSIGLIKQNAHITSTELAQQQSPKA